MSAISPTKLSDQGTKSFTFIKELDAYIANCASNSNTFAYNFWGVNISDAVDGSYLKMLILNLTYKTTQLTKMQVMPGVCSR